MVGTHAVGSPPNAGSTERAATTGVFVLGPNNPESYSRGHLKLAMNSLCEKGQVKIRKSINKPATVSTRHGWLVMKSSRVMNWPACLIRIKVWPSLNHSWVFR